MIEGIPKKPTHFDILKRPKRINLNSDSDDELSPKILYLNDISAYPVPNSVQVVLLFQGRENRIPLSEILKSSDFDQPFRRAYKDCRTTDEVIILGNQGLVVEVASRYYEKGSLTFLDFVSFGNSGLRTAIARYNFQIGKFSPFAVHWIRRDISLGILHEGNMINIPGGEEQLLKKAKKAEQELSRKLGRDLSYRERIQAYGSIASAKTAHSIIELNDSGVLVPPMSLNLPAFREDANENPERGEYIVSSGDVWEQIEGEIMKEAVDDLIDSLTTRERTVIQLRFGLHGKGVRTLKEIGDSVGVGKERIRQIEGEALEQLGNHDNLRRMEAFRQDATVCYPPADLRPEPRLTPSQEWVEFRKNGPVEVIQKRREN